MKELDSFTVEQLNDFIKSDHAQCGDVAALARIALAAKRAEPVAWEVKGILCHSKEEADSYVGEPVPLYEAPQLNSPEIPEDWKLTPINPTAEMMAAAMECDDVVFDLDDDTIFCVQFDNIYAAMLAAAPEKPL
ncbi:hypothetical protein V5E43_002131 [Yersinia enterocolitica]|uniref:hypothetical protein n=1 Tax=Yersinia enterocolitica TaxID=630 RepID=UPI001E40ACA2|nr:hypothetical protein [Yersinia enterocolitica]MCE3068277.1 hypothetical protein [Yersinia enterocolitica]UNA05600.1 hypothetical protein vBYenM06161_034 [Yersinia phage vB_YenM_06.16-1]